MGQIFLSYARRDRPFVERIAKVLEQAGQNVWWDRRLDSGEEFSAEIEAALDKSDVVLVAWSKESIRSRWVRDEAAVGGDTGRLVPISLDGSLPPMGFRQFHTLDLTGWKGTKRDERTAELLHSIDRRLRAKGEGTGEAPREVSAKRRFAFPKAKLRWAVAALLVIVVAVGGALLYNSRNTQNGPVKPTIGLLPFSTPSSDGQLGELASQTRDSVAHTFSQSGLPLRPLSTAPQAGRSPADFVISGDVSRNGEKVVVTVRLDEVAHGVTVFSRQFQAGPDELADFPERVGVQTAAALTDASALMDMDRRRPLDPAIIADLLSEDFLGDQLQGYQTAKRVAAKAPNLLTAQLGFAFFTSFVLDQIPRGEREEAVAEARRATERAVRLGPNEGGASGAWCALHSETLFAQCEDRLRANRKVNPDSVWLNTFLGHLFRDVGRIDEAVDLARLSYSHDIYVPQKIAWLLRVLEYTGDGDEARQLYQQGARWWPEYKDMFVRNRIFGLIDRGDFDAIQKLEREVDATKLMPGYHDSAALLSALKSKSIPAARQACAPNPGALLTLRCMLVFAKLGDQDGAYAIADRLYPRRVGRSQPETEQIWLDNPDGPPTEFITSPGAAAMRRDPRYLPLVERVGLLAYWRSGRPPDFCRAPHPEPVCAELLKRS